MICKDNEIKIYYRCKEGVNIALDEALESHLNTLGYRRWASGCNLESGVRDLAFEKIGYESLPDYV